MDTQTAQPLTAVSQPVIPTAPKLPIEPKAKPSKWILAVIVLLVLLAVGGVAVYFLNNSSTTKTKNTQNAVGPTTFPSATPSQAVNWKTYTNTKHGFSIDYPSNWDFRESPDSKNGAGFNPLDKPGYPDKSDSITISAGQKMGGYDDKSLEEYAKVAGMEIQNYNDLASLKRVTTVEGIVGYQTTWMVQPMSVMGQPSTGGETESLPIAYFELPNSKTLLVRVTLNREEDLVTYEKMLTSLKFTAIPTKSQVTPTTAAKVDEKTVLQSAIKQALATKFGNDGSTLNVSVSKIEGNYAQGAVSDEGGGGMWFAAKVNGVWKLVWDGNGVILCTDLAPYPDFPTSMIPECYNETTQSPVKR